VNAAEASSLIVDQVQEIAALRALAHSRGVDATSYRVLAIESLHYAHRLQDELQQLTDRYHRALTETRELRAALMGRRAAA
jgi:hypothetical protein